MRTEKEVREQLAIWEAEVAYLRDGARKKRLETYALIAEWVLEDNAGF